MTTKPTRRLLAALCLLAGVCSCTDESDPAEKIGNAQSLAINYQIDGAEQAQTYALTADAHECKVDEIYTLFFRSATHAQANQYVGYTRTGVASSASSGTARVTMPANTDVTDEWQLIVLANLDRFAHTDGEATIDSWLINKVGTKSYTDAKEYIQVLSNQPTGLLDPLPMSVAMTKPAATNLATVTLQRRVARIDVVSSASGFVFESAQIFNARTMAYMLNEGGNISTTGGNDFVHYDQHVVSNASGKIQGKLYAFPNAVMTPTMTDLETTCLIIGGKYGGSPTTTYYRVNVCPASGSQNLKPNGAYTINITGVTAAGEIDPDEALKASFLKCTYTINEWDNSFLGTYVFDADGNGLAVSQRSVVYSDKGNQTIQLEVFTIKSTTNPIAGSWNVGALTGTNPTAFTATKDASPTDKYITATAPTANATTTDRTAAFTVTWGGISLPVSLTQLNPTSQMSGIKANPSELWFPKNSAATPKEICLNLQGNFAGIAKSNIKHQIIYEAGSTGWLTLSDTGITPDNAALGLYYYTVTADALSSGDIRLAAIKFVVTQGAQILTAQVDVRQTLAEIGTSYTRILDVRMFEKVSGAYVEKGSLADVYANIKGLPTGKSEKNDLHFAIIEHTTLKYELRITSSMGWKLVPVGLAASELNYSLMSDPGDMTASKTITITATGDKVSGWDGTFYIEYDNGDKTTFAVHQQGVFATLAAYKDASNVLVTDGSTYYYGTFRMNDKLWLDRNIGATSDSYYTTFGTTAPKDNTGKGVYIDYSQANKVCPNGFRLPKSTAGSGELDWVFTNIRYSGTSVTSDPAVPYGFVWYVTTSHDPAKHFFLPMSGSAYTGFTGTYCMYHSEASSTYLYLIASSTVAGSTKTMYSSHPWGASVRCIQK